MTIKDFLALRAVLPRLATEGLLLLAWPKSNKNPRLASFLVKTYGNLYLGSIQALTLAYPIAPALILPWVVGYEGDCKDFRAFSYENLLGRIAGCK